MTPDEAFRLAAKNVAAFGDTDIFPSPLDRFPCADKIDEVVKALEEIDRTFHQYLASHPPENINALAPLGYTAFRWATQIDPIWNLYYLALVLLVAESIEAKRIPETERTVFSYRFRPDPNSAHLFGNSTWRDYKKRAIEMSHTYPIVLVADVAEFYPRVSHHKLENELLRLGLTTDYPKRIKTLFSKFSQTRSYGLPIGGPASRILAELALNPVDTFLHRKQIPFCRYVDDFHIFANSQQEAYNHLAFLAQLLFNEGLSLQKTKTRILTAKELRDASTYLDFTETDDPSELPPEARLMRLSLRYDPYSPTAEEDYESLKDAVSSIDIVGILSREIAKSNIDTQITKQAIIAIRALAPEHRGGAVQALLKPESLETLAPVFSNIMRLFRSLYEDLDEKTKDLADKTMIGLFNEDSHLIHIDLNLAYLLKVFGQRRSSEKETILIKLYDDNQSPLIRKEIILIMTKWGATYWLSNILGRFDTLSKWERKAFIVAAYHMNDEGKHWLDHIKLTLSPDQNIVRKWYKERMKLIKEVPL
ncbi:RNA-directed DNA polymerase [Luteolibacter pohnpeiensis]|uniref:RNA-directed DNA polymerase n=1 Tax=Luteolibacter pohnpeiensis TaxID=454153 RepID=A0A934SF60_9BACT|nr:RNA-directed DNA polymerase [Luteolibacter pohnpeiensis]MBK1884058.1 RNA-directed DNA polymerase [Luteolibacter pohnpeiensis]